MSKLRKRRRKNSAPTQSREAKKALGHHTKPSALALNEQVIVDNHSRLANQRYRYQYVIADIKRTCLIAVPLFLALVILSLFLK